MTIRLGLWIATVLALFAAGFFTGARITAASYQADIIKEQNATADLLAAAARQANAQAEELEQARAKREIIYRTITKTVDRIVDRPVYRSVCLDDDGLRIANEALTGTPADTSQPDATLPDADASGRQDGR